MPDVLSAEPHSSRVVMLNCDAAPAPALGLGLGQAYKEAEETYCKSFASGACSVSVVLKGRKLYTANCGDSMALVVKYDPEFKRPAGPPVPLNDRHAVYLSDNERERLLKAGAEVSQQVGLEDALIARNAADGQIYKGSCALDWSGTWDAVPTTRDWTLAREWTHPIVSADLLPPTHTHTP